MRVFTNRPLPAAYALIKNAQEVLIRRGILPPQRKAGVPAVGVSDLGDINGTQDLRPLIEERFLFSRLPGTTEQPFKTRLVVPVGAAAGPVGEKRAIPAVRILFDLHGLTPKKFGSLTVQSNEAVHRGGTATARGLQTTLIRDVTDSTNVVALSDAAASDDAPAGLGFGAPVIDATGDLAADVRALVGSVSAGADPASLAFATDAWTAAKLGTAVDTAGALLFPNVGISGGELLGVPVIVTKASPLDGSPAEGALFLIDGSAIIYGLDGIDWQVSQDATIELSDAPTGDGHTPTTQSQQIVSLFQEEMSGFKAVLRADWKKLRSNAVAVLAGI